MMKKEYIAPQMDVIKFEAEDAITASSPVIDTEINDPNYDKA